MGLEIRADLAARSLDTTAGIGMAMHSGQWSGPLPILHTDDRHDDATMEIFDLHVLVDGAQFEVFGHGGRTNIALRVFPNYNGIASSAFVECSSADVHATVEGWEMDKLRLHYD